MDREQFLEFVGQYVSTDPEVAPHVAQAVERGLSAALTEANIRAADMESALAFALSQRLKDKDYAFIQTILKRYEGRSALDWTSTLRRLEQRA